MFCVFGVYSVRIKEYEALRWNYLSSHVICMNHEYTNRASFSNINTSTSAIYYKVDKLVALSTRKSISSTPRSRGTTGRREPPITIHASNVPINNPSRAFATGGRRRDT